MAQFLIQQMDEIMGTYQTTIATLSTYNITPAQQEALAVTEGQLTWLVYIIGAVVGGHSWSSTHLDDGEEIIDASLSRRTLRALPRPLDHPQFHGNRVQCILSSRCVRRGKLGAHQQER